MVLGLKSKIDLLSTIFCTPRHDAGYDPEPVTLSLGVNTALNYLTVHQRKEASQARGSTVDHVVLSYQKP